MKKNYIGVLLLVSFLCFSENEDYQSAIFEQYEQSVVFISDTLFLNGTHVANRALFERIEKKYNIKILDNYLPLLTGSGFCITDDGYILTNNHVVHVPDIQEIKTVLYDRLIRDLFGKIPSSVLSFDEYTSIKKDLKNVVDGAVFQYRITLDNAKEYTTEVVSVDNELDLALLKIKEDVESVPAPLGDSDLLKVGNPVVAIGYPVSDDIFEAVKEFKSTMTSGVISALRSDNWGIQHTSAISPGNSGGPLFNKQGEVIGINVGAVVSGSDLFFSIPINKVVRWLNGTSYANLIIKNKTMALGLGREYQLDQNGYLRVGSSIFVNVGGTAQVYLDDEFKGNAPVLLEHLSQGVHTVRIESAPHHKSQKIKVDPENQDILTYQPHLDVYTGKLFVNSVPAGALIIVDGNKMGNTPAVLNAVTVGEHSLTLKKEGYQQESDHITIEKDGMERINLHLDKIYAVHIKKKLPDQTKISAKSDTSVLDFTGEDSIELAPGRWHLLFTNELFAPVEYVVEITNADQEIEIAPEIYSGTITFDQLTADSKVFIDDEALVAQTDDDGTLKINRTIGTHTIRIERVGYKPFEKSITLEKNMVQSVSVLYVKDPNVYYMSGERELNRAIAFDIASIFLIGAGCGALAGGIYLINDSLTTASSNYDDYGAMNGGDLKMLGGDMLVIVGSVAIITGGTLFLVSLPLYGTYKRKHDSYIKKITMDFSVGNGMAFALHCRF